MVRLQLVGCLAILVLIASGCAMCCDINDYAYPTFGGKYQRTDPYWGRVGSVYSDPLADQREPYSGERRDPRQPEGETIEPAPSNPQPARNNQAYSAPDFDAPLSLRPPALPQQATPGDGGWR